MTENIANVQKPIQQASFRGAMWRLFTMAQGVLMFLGIMHVAMLAGLYEPSITVSPAMAQAVAETVQSEYDSQRAIVAKLNAPARKAKN